MSGDNEFYLSMIKVVRFWSTRHGPTCTSIWYCPMYCNLFVMSCSRAHLAAFDWLVVMMKIQTGFLNTWHPPPHEENTNKNNEISKSKDFPHPNSVLVEGWFLYLTWVTMLCSMWRTSFAIGRVGTLSSTTCHRSCTRR